MAFHSISDEAPFCSSMNTWGDYYLLIKPPRAISELLKWMNSPQNRMPKLTQWGEVRHICINKLDIIGSDNGLAPSRHQAIIWTNTILLFQPLGRNFGEISIEIHIFSFKKMHLKMPSAKWRPFCLGLNSSPPGQNGCQFGRQYFPMHYLEWKRWNSDSNSIEICSQDSNWQYASIGSGNGLVPNRRQAITWINGDPIHWCIYASLEGDELMC